jgi:hypothetical protein
MSTVDRQGDIQVYTLRKKDIVKLQSSTTTVVFESANQQILNAAYKFDGSYVVDRDVFSSEVISAKKRVRVVYEATANSRDISQADFIIKLWNSGTTFSAISQSTIMTSPFLHLL